MSYLIIFILIIVVSFLCLKLYLVKQQLKKIAKQMEEQSESTVSIDLVDKDLEAVTIQINHMMDSLQNVRAEAMKGEQNLRNSISMISHDMRTPLTSVIGYLQLAKKNCQEEETLQEIEIALDRAAYCNKLVNDFFELSVIDSNTYTPVLEKVNLCEVICEEILANYLSFEEKGITPTFEQADDSVWVLVDRKLLTRVIQNLISNSIKYSTGKVEFSVSEGRKALLDISSSTSRKVDAEKVFDRFYRADNSRGSDGIGLGLYICRKLIEEMNGTISAESDNDMFHIKIELNLY